MCIWQFETQKQAPIKCKSLTFSIARSDGVVVDGTKQNVEVVNKGQAGRAEGPMKGSSSVR